jgi:MYXO-CTERM domain-containing protein
VRLRQSIAGIPVEDRGARVLVDADGSAKIASAAVEERAPAARRPTLDAKTAASMHRYLRVPLDATRAHLAYVPTPSGPVLSWIVPGDVPWELPLRPVVAIDANSGARVYAVDRVRRAKQVHAFGDNPVKTPTLSTFTIAALDGGKTLTSPSWDVFSCVDKGTVRTVTLFGPTIKMHTCDVLHAAGADAAGDFLYPRPASDTAVDDLFAETSAAYHVDRALRAYSGLGLTMLRPEARPLTVVANVRNPPSWEAGPTSALGCATCKLEALDNAYYAPQDDYNDQLFGVKKDGLFLGQGIKVDYSYDGDVVYHELGHAVVESTAKLVPFAHFDSQGATMQPGAMNEGIADYLSSTVTGDPNVGEYAGGAGAIRSLDNKDGCPGTLTNEVHQDSLPFSGTLWEARSKTKEPAKFDRGVLLGLELLPSGDASFGDMLAVLEKSVAKETGDTSVGDLLASVAASRGVQSCNRVLDLDAGGGKASWDYGFFAYGLPYAPMGAVKDLLPGVAQFKKTLPSGTTQIRISWSGRTLPPEPAWLGDGMPFDAAMLVKFDAPIVWTRAGGSWSGDFTVRRDVDGELPLETIDVPPGAKDVYLMVATRGDGSGLYDAVEVDPIVGLPDSGPPPLDTGIEDSGTPVDAALPSDAGDGGFTPAAAQDPYDVVNGRACGCEVPGEPQKSGVSLALAGLALGIVARRRTKK